MVGLKHVHVNPFTDWGEFRPSRTMWIWRERHESRIIEAFEALAKLEQIKKLLNGDTLRFCDKCDAMKCYGALYPICEPVLKKLRTCVQE